MGKVSNEEILMRSARLSIIAAMATVQLIIMAAVAIAGPPGREGQAGNSNVYQCALGEGPQYDGQSWGTATIKDLGEGGLYFHFKVHGLMPGEVYELRSGGAFDPPVTATANGGGNVQFKAAKTDPGARANVWLGSDRILYTDTSACVLP
jgi:hypothetical protein